METIRIRVVATQGGGYLVRLLTTLEPMAGGDSPSAAIPADLDAAIAPDVLGNGAKDEAIRQFVLENEESTEFAALGEYLGGLLLRGEVGLRWDEFRRSHPEGFRTLLDIEPANLRLIPWELMTRNEGRLFLDASAVLARVDQLSEDEAQELVPLRLLVVEGEQDEALGTDLEMRGIKAALPDFKGRVDAEFLREPTQSELKEAFERVRPHIFHFMGHGMRDPNTDQPALKLRGWLLTRQYIIDFLPNVPRLAVLNACRSGDVAGIRALTEALLSRGTTAVIGMQGDVRGSAAGRFGSELYRGLAQGQTVDQAVATARKNVLLLGGNNLSRDWSLPSLTLRVEAEKVLPFFCGISEEERQQVEAQLYEPIGLFVDRTKKRWELAAAADPDHGSPDRLVMIVGDSEVGKTWLVNWIRTRCALRGKRVRYVDFKALENLNFVRALEVIRDTPEDVTSLADEARGSFDRFTYDLGFLSNGALPPEPGDGPANVPPIPERLQLGGENIEKIFDSFRAGLESATAAEPMLVIFDHVGKINETDFKTRIYQNLIRLIAEGEPENVRLILVLSSDQRRDYWPAEEHPVMTEVKVDLIPLDEYEDCAEEIVLALQIEFGENHEKLIEAMRQFIPPHFRPTDLAPFTDVVKKARA